MGMDKVIRFQAPYSQLIGALPGLRLMYVTVPVAPGRVRRQVSHGLIWTPGGMVRVDPGQTIVRAVDGSVRIIPALELAA